LRREKTEKFDEWINKRVKIWKIFVGKNEFEVALED
jgi:hypothetical protein